MHMRDDGTIRKSQKLGAVFNPIFTDSKNDYDFKVSATLQSAIFRYLGFLHSQIDLYESFLLQKQSEKNMISVKRYRGQKILSC